MKTLATLMITAAAALMASDAAAGIRIFQFEGRRESPLHSVYMPPCAPTCAPDPTPEAKLVVDVAFRYATWDGQGDAPATGYQVAWSGTRFDVAYAERQWRYADFAQVYLDDFARALLSHVTGYPPNPDGYFRVEGSAPATPSRPGLFLVRDGGVVDDAYGWRYFVSANVFNLYTDRLTAVPEPTGWALIILGTATLGAALRRRRAAIG